MEPYIKKSEIVAEIERERAYLSRDYHDECGAIIAYDKVLSFLDTLEMKEVEVPVSNNLEEAAMQYAKSKHKDTTLQQIVSWDFKAGAQWQKQQMIDKAYEWLQNHNDYLRVHDNGRGVRFDITQCVIDFRKAMEE